MASKIFGTLLVLFGVAANNFAYLQDLWFGQGSITLDSWRAYGAIGGSVGILLVGLLLVLRGSGAKHGR